MNSGLQPMIPYGRQDISEADIEAVVGVLRSDWLTQGPVVPRFEQAVADWTGGSFATAVSSATAGLHIACAALGLQAGDTLWTSPNTFVASANAAKYCGAAVEFIDIDPQTYNMSVECLTNRLIEAEKVGRLPKIVMPVHFAGQSCEMLAISQLSRKYGFRVIEDASHAIGGKYRGKNVGCCEFSDAVVFSFHPVKIITTGEGGMVVTRDEQIHNRLQRLRSHGITRNPDQMVGSSPGAWYYEQLELGWNYRMTDIQAALGISQMGRLEEFVEKRRALSASYEAALGGIPVVLPWQHSDTQSSWHLYVVQLQLDRINRSRAEVFQYLRNYGIGVNVHYIPVNMQPFYQMDGSAKCATPEAFNYYQRAISLPMYAGLSGEQMEQVVRILKKACFDV